MTALISRETKNSQFDFLKPQHALFGYFSSLVECYVKIFKKAEYGKINHNIIDKESIIKKSTDRYLWEKRQREDQKKKDNIDEMEKQQMLQIDWYDFVIVETINFTKEEMYNTVPIIEDNDINNENNINSNINSMQANLDILYKQNQIKDKVIDIEVPVEPKEEIEYQTENNNLLDRIKDSEVVKIKHSANEVPELGLKIVTNYRRKTDNINKTIETSKCPLCNEMINIEDIVEHIRIELIDPRWRELNKELQKTKDINLNTPSEFINNLSSFSRNRPDLFGEVNEVVKIEEQKKIESSKLKNEVWSGYAPNMTRTTANIAMLQEQNRKNVEESRKSTEIASMQGKMITPQITVAKGTTVKNDEFKNNNQTLDDLKKQIYNTPNIKKSLLSEETWLKKYPVKYILN